MRKEYVCMRKKEVYDAENSVFAYELQRIPVRRLKLMICGKQKIAAL